jgi:hypothetical protein
VASSVTVTLYTTEPAAMWLLVQYLYPCDAVPACYGLYSGALVNMWNVLRKVLTQTLFYGESLPFVGTMLLEPSWLVCWFGGLIGHSILAPRATIGHWTSDGNRVGKMLGEDTLSVCWNAWLVESHWDGRMTSSVPLRFS